MDSEASIFFSRAELEFRLAKALLNVSQNEALKDAIGVLDSDTFYSAVISHSYYSIFYSAKAVLLTKGVKTDSPNVHKKTLDAFKEHLVDTGILDVALLNIYKQIVVQADELLGIFKDEKFKRGHFTYKTIPEANILPAKESVDNAQKFLTNLKAVIKVSR